MEYNTQRTALQMPEYGRMIQEMVEICRELPTKEARNEAAATIIEFMGQRNPHLNDEENYKHKLWNHLFILASYDLDVDSPYPILSQEELSTKPRKMPYPSFDNDYKFYGKSILQLIEHAIELDAGDEKDALIQVIANNMKKSYNVYNKEHVQDDVIFRHLKDLSNNRLDLTGLDSLDKSKIYYNTNRKNNNNNSNHNKNNRNQNTNNNAKRRHQNNQNNQKNRK
ncbi:DUF4290 domain-containing protein [Chryseobacterium sp. POL2]|uniref:DUF4290 domain-containing protein n=1 Tax=Chryseobacterium sp. POL2 TaxID=2713414 RepID=UPI0013E1B0C1|nr:DUF4290 domain-containing protein [Chryseobacterium sp. POL2]QIG89222.1 DUF4290 domain-containing protein [Chryseobacterium sp. POL2]